jgi:hypothetical protein
MPGTAMGALVPEFRVTQGDGRDEILDVTNRHFPYYLSRARDPEVWGTFDRVFWSGALLVLGDRLARHNYFDRAPVLEFIRYLRNGIAHGNEFEIRNPAALRQYPAHVDAAQNIYKEDRFEIHPTLQGKRVLFEYIGALSLSRVFVEVSFHLMRMAHGERPAG